MGNVEFESDGMTWINQVIPNSDFSRRLQFGVWCLKCHDLHSYSFQTSGEPAGQRNVLTCSTLGLVYTYIFYEVSTGAVDLLYWNESDEWIKSYLVFLIILFSFVGKPIQTWSWKMSEEIKAESVPITATAAETGGSKAPPGLEGGGTWGTAKYIGDQSKLIMCLMCICCPPCCFYILCCPQDEKDAYQVGGKVSWFVTYVWNPEIYFGSNLFIFLKTLLGVWCIWNSSWKPRGYKIRSIQELNNELISPSL